MIMSLYGRTWRGRFTTNDGEIKDVKIIISPQPLLSQIKTEWSCIRGKCTYKTGFLSKGPETLDHRAYHSFQSDFMCWREIYEKYVAAGLVPPKEVCNNLYRLSLLLRLI